MKEKEYIVLDCSVTLSWLKPSGHEIETADKILLLLDKTIARVPTIWPLEVVNFLAIAEKQKHLTALEVAEFKEFLSSLPIEIDNSTSFHAMGSIHTLAASEQLTSYDAAYLEIAIRESFPLATFDKALKKAAERNGVIVL